MCRKAWFYCGENFVEIWKTFASEMTMFWKSSLLRVWPLELVILKSTWTEGFLLAEIRLSPRSSNRPVHVEQNGLCSWVYKLIYIFGQVFWGVLTGREKEPEAVSLGPKQLIHSADSTRQCTQLIPPGSVPAGSHSVSSHLGRLLDYNQKYTWGVFFGGKN